MGSKGASGAVQHREIFGRQVAIGSVASVSFRVLRSFQSIRSRQMGPQANVHLLMRSGPGHVPKPSARQSSIRPRTCSAMRGPKWFSSWMSRLPRPMLDR